MVVPIFTEGITMDQRGYYTLIRGHCSNLNVAGSLFIKLDDFVLLKDTI